MLIHLVKIFSLKLKTTSITKLYWWFFGLFYFFALLRIIGTATINEGIFYIIFPFIPFLSFLDIENYLIIITILIIMAYIADLTIYKFFNKLKDSGLKKTLTSLSYVARTISLFYISVLMVVATWILISSLPNYVVLLTLIPLFIIYYIISTIYKNTANIRLKRIIKITGTIFKYTMLIYVSLFLILTILTILNRHTEINMPY